MRVERQWAWYLLACIVLAAVAWTARNEYAACEADGCVVINRWTGSIEFRDAAWYEEPTGAPDIVLDRAPGVGPISLRP